jgi:hypothetical protein
MPRKSWGVWGESPPGNPRKTRNTPISMSIELSPQTEQYLASIVAGGLFPTKEAALEAAVEAFRTSAESLPLVPAEHMERVEQGMASALAGRARELTDADWESIREGARQAAARKRSGSS